MLPGGCCSVLHLLRLALLVSVEGTGASAHSHAFLLLSAHSGAVWELATVAANHSWAWKRHLNLTGPVGGPVVGVGASFLLRLY